MTDEELDRLIDKLKPDLRIAFRAMLAGELGHAFDIDGTYSVSAERKPAWLTLFLTREPLTGFFSTAACVYGQTEPPADSKLNAPRSEN